MAKFGKSLLILWGILILQLNAKCLTDATCDIDQICSSGSCVHKNLFPNIASSEIGATFVFFSATIICTVAGVGGGIVFLPMLMLMFNFSTQEAAPISITVVFFILIIRNLLSFGDRHPMRDKPVINYDIALVFSAADIIGNIFGMIINVVSPSWIILIFIVILMSLNGYFTGQKALQLLSQSKEQRDKNNSRTNLSEEAMNYLEKLRAFKAVLSTEVAKTASLTTVNTTRTIEENSQMIIKKNPLKNPSSKLIEMADNSVIVYVLPLESAAEQGITVKEIDETIKKLEQILKKERRFMDYEKIALLVFNLMILVLFNLLKGSKTLGSIAGVTYCGSSFWVLQFIYIPFGLSYFAFVIWLLTRESQMKLEAGYIFHQSDLKWTFATCTQLFLNGLFVGVISSLLGISGAIFSGPLLLKLGVEPQEATFTASFMSLFSSTASVILYLISGKIRWDYAGFYGGICVIAMIIGLKGILGYLKRKNLMFGIVFVLVFMIIVATVLNVYSNVREIVTKEDARHFRNFC